jgi:hypothetical protein
MLESLQDGLDMAHIPYRGGAPALTDLMGGQVQVYFASASESLGYIKSGEMRALGATGQPPCGEDASAVPRGVLCNVFPGSPTPGNDPHPAPILFLRSARPHPPGGVERVGDAALVSGAMRPPCPYQHGLRFWCVGLPPAAEACVMSLDWPCRQRRGLFVSPATMVERFTIASSAMAGLTLPSV